MVELAAELRALDLSFDKREIRSTNLRVDHGNLFGEQLTDRIYEYMERNLTYLSADESQIRIFGKWHKIPRRQVAYGDAGLDYKFSGKVVTARDWDPVLEAIRDLLETKIKTERFNFVLVNRYADGSDYIGEHKDDEKDLDPTAPIASISFGETRDFVLRHESRKRKKDEKCPENITVPLHHGDLLMLWPPTNSFWYHSIPKRKRANGCRINLTFRKMIP